MRTRKFITLFVLLGLLLLPFVEMRDIQVVKAQDDPPLKATDGGPIKYEESEEDDIPQELHGSQQGEVVTQELVDETLGKTPPPKPPNVNEEDLMEVGPSMDFTSTSIDPNQGNGIQAIGLMPDVSVLDSFDRADGPIGSEWTVHDGYCNVSSNAAICGSFGRATYNTPPGGGNAAEVDVAAVGTDIQFTGLLLNYGAGVNNLFLKVQQQDYSGMFSHAACYVGNNTTGFGLGFFGLDSNFTTAHMKAARVGDTVTIVFSNIDGGSQPDQTYVCTGAPTPEGPGIGIMGHAGIARLDNFGIPAGPNVLLLEADDDISGSSPIQDYLLAYEDLGTVDLFDAQTSTPALSLLQAYDVVVTWSNYVYANPTAIGDVLADYIDSGGKVINTIASMGTHGWEMMGRFMTQNYTAMNGTSVTYSTSCLGSNDPSHPIMKGITDVCDYFRLNGTTLTPGSSEIARWADGQLFVAVKDDRSVVSIAGYIGSNDQWTGQMDDLVHNAIFWLYSNWEEIATDPIPLMDNVLAAYDGKVWNITGYGADAHVSYYVPATNSWTTVSDSEPPFSNNYARSGCQVGDKVYIYGDTYTPGFTGLWRYDLGGNAWISLSPSGTPPSLTGIWAPSWVADPSTGICYMTGGATTPGDGNLKTVYVYDTKTNTWQSPLPNFTTERDFHAAFIFRNPSDGHKLLCVAGGDKNPSIYLDSTQCYDFNSTSWHAENTDLGVLPLSLWGMGYTKRPTAAGDQLWLVNGMKTGGLLYPGTWYYDVTMNAWVNTGPLESGEFYRTSAVTLYGIVYHVGGSTLPYSPSGLSDRFVGHWVPWHTFMPMIMK